MCSTLPGSAACKTVFLAFVCTNLCTGTYPYIDLHSAMTTSTMHLGHAPRFHGTCQSWFSSLSMLCNVEPSACTSQFSQHRPRCGVDGCWHVRSETTGTRHAPASARSRWSLAACGEGKLEAVRYVTWGEKKWFGCCCKQSEVGIINGHAQIYGHDCFSACEHSRHSRFFLKHAPHPVVLMLRAMPVASLAELVIYLVLWPRLQHIVEAQVHVAGMATNPCT